MLISRVEAAKLLEVKVPSIDRALRTGRIFYADPDKLLFDKAALIACWAENRQRRRKPVPASVAAPPPGQVSEAELRRRLLHAQVLDAERRANADGGDSIAVAAVARAVRSWVGGAVAGIQGAGANFERDLRGAIPGRALACVPLRRMCVSWGNGVVYAAISSLGLVLARENAALGRAVAEIAELAPGQPAEEAAK